MLTRFLTYCRSGIATVLAVMQAELSRILHDAGMLIFFFLVPLAYPLLYGYIYTNEVLHEVPVVVVDADHSTLSRKYIRLVDASPDVRIMGHATDMADAEKALRERKAYGIVFVPEDFSSGLAESRQVYVSIFTDTSGLLYYKSLLMANTAVSLKMNAEIKVAHSDNTTAMQDKLTQRPIDYNEVSIFNPQNGFASFLIPAVLVLILQQTLLLGAAMAAGTQREIVKRSRRNRNFIALHPWLLTQHHAPLPTVIGKAAAYLLAYLPVAVYVLGVVPRIFTLNQIGNPADMALFILPFLLTSIFFALSLAQAFRRRETCMLTIVFTSVPLLFLTGISWPSAAIPTGWKIFSYAFPSTFGANGFIKINNMGATLSDVKLEWFALWIQAAFYFCMAVFLTGRKSRLQQALKERNMSA